MRFNLLNSQPFHVIAVTETRFHPKFTDKMANLTNYNIVRNDRLGRTGGGVALYINNNLKYKVLIMSTNHGNLGLAEYLMCEIILQGHHKLFVAVVYRPPNSPFYKGTDFLEKLSNYCSEYNNKLIMGDFNSNMLTDNPQSSIMREFIDLNGLKLINHGVTHITDTSTSHIDLCLVDEHNTVINYDKSEGPFILNHFLISITLQLFSPRPLKKTITYRKINNIDKSELCNYLLRFDWEIYFYLEKVDDILFMLEARINKSIDKFAPQITYSLKKRLEPWVTSELKSDNSNCTRLYRKCKRNPTSGRLQAYRDAKNSFNSQREIAKDAFYKNRLASNSDPQKFWAEIKNLGLIESSENTEPIFSLDTLNNYYSSVQCPDDDISTPILNSSAIIEKFTFSEITDSDVLKPAKYFKSKYVGVDKISIQIINLCLPKRDIYSDNQSLFAYTSPYDHSLI